MTLEARPNVRESDLSPGSIPIFSLGELRRLDPPQLPHPQGRPREWSGVSRGRAVQ